MKDHQHNEFKQIAATTAIAVKKEITWRRLRGVTKGEAQDYLISWRLLDRSNN